VTEQSNLPVPAGDSGITLGQQHLDAGDLILPRVKVVQAMSQEAQGKKDERKAEPGDFFNTLTGVNYGAELPFIPILPFKQRVLLVRQERRGQIEDALGTELSEGDGLKCRSYDMQQGVGEPGIACDECPLSKWDGNKPPLCTETYNVAALDPDGDLIIISMAKSGAKTGKRLFSMLRLASGAPWKKQYKATTTVQSNELGTFYVPDVAVDASEIPAPELMRQAETWNRTLGGQVLDVTPEDDEPVTTATGDF
jgi:hypothetical protein